MLILLADLTDRLIHKHRPENQGFSQSHYGRRHCDKPGISLINNTHLLSFSFPFILSFFSSWGEFSLPVHTLIATIPSCHSISPPLIKTSISPLLSSSLEPAGLNETLFIPATSCPQHGNSDLALWKRQSQIANIAT